MATRSFDTLVFSRELYEQNKPKMAFSATTRQGATAWQSRLRTKLIELLGGFPEKPCDLRWEVKARATYPGYTREQVVFQSRPNMSVYGYFLQPEGFHAPGPALICLPGHGRGVDDIVGIADDQSIRSEHGGYQMDFAVQAVEHGFCVFAIEQFGFGHRRDRAKHDPYESTCSPAAGAALLLGQTMIGWRVYDAIRAIDYLSTRKEVDPKRIGCVGISGGGTTALYTACIDKRIAGALVSGYFNTFRDSVLSISHCIDNYIPGILQYAEMYDLAGLIAPRALFVENGDRDTIFPAKAARMAFEKTKAIYTVFGAEEKIGRQIFKGEHSFCGEQGFPFLKRWL